MTTERIVVRPGEGKSVWLGGLGVDFKLWGEDTAGQFAVVEHPLEAGRLVYPHIHDREDEFSYVLEGQIGARVGDQELTAGPGCYVLKPRRVPHTFWNPGPGPARVLEIISPAGFERYFEQAPTVTSRGEGEALASRYGLGPVPEWHIEDLKARYHLKLLGETPD